MTEKYAYICTNYNNSNFSIDASESFLTQFGEHATVIIVDNGSDRNFVNDLNNYANGKVNVVILDTRENTGYFSGLNQGLEFICTMHDAPKWVFVGNNDLIFQDGIADAVASKLKFLESFPVISPNLITLDGIHQNPHIISGISHFRRFVYSFYYRNFLLARLIIAITRMSQSFSKRPDTNSWRIGQKIWAGHGACYLLTPDFFKKMCRLDSHSFLYFEEVFLAQQIERLGGSIWYEPSLVIKHLCNGSIGKLPNRKVWEFSRDAYNAYLGQVSESKDGVRRKL